MNLLKIAILGSVWSFYWFFPQQSLATTTVFSEDFSNGLHQWYPTRDDGSLWSIVNGKAQAFIDQPSTITELVPLDLVWDPNWKNIEYSLEFTPILGFDKNISFVFQNLENWYELHFVENFVNLVRVQEGHTPFNLFFPFSMVNGHTYQLKIRYQEGHITVVIDGQEVINTVDWTFNQNFGKIGLKAGTGAAFPTQVIYDNIVVTLLDDISFTLNVPLFKQSDDRWKSDEYDSATTWSSEPSISRWGCALASATMILQYHGITTLPDGSDLNPGTLNTWLKSQVDGYLGEGNLNWLAISRLTKMVSSRLTTPVLEYRRHAGDTLDIAKTEISHQKPVVLELDGHFLVGDGLNQDQTDILIKDPAYQYQLLSQHQTPILSTRTFQPSQTDLSYIVLVYNHELTVNLKTSAGKPVPNVEVFTESLQAQEVSEKTSATAYLQLPKPETGTYLIEVQQAKLKNYELTVLNYDADGLPSVSKLKGIVGPQPLQFQLHYDKHQPSSVAPITSWQTFRHHLKTARQHHGFRALFWYYLMDQTALQATKSQSRFHKKYLQLLKSELKASRFFMTSSAYSYLEQQLQALSSKY